MDTVSWEIRIAFLVWFGCTIDSFSFVPDPDAEATEEENTKKEERPGPKNRSKRDVRFEAVLETRIGETAVGVEMQSIGLLVEPAANQSIDDGYIPTDDGMTEEEKVERSKKVRSTKPLSDQSIQDGYIPDGALTEEERVEREDRRRRNVEAGYMPDGGHTTPGDAMEEDQDVDRRASHDAVAKSSSGEQYQQERACDPVEKQEKSATMPADTRADNAIDDGYLPSDANLGTEEERSEEEDANTTTARANATAQVQAAPSQETVESESFASVLVATALVTQKGASEVGGIARLASLPMKKFSRPKASSTQSIDEGYIPDGALTEEERGEPKEIRRGSINESGYVPDGRMTPGDATDENQGDEGERKALRVAGVELAIVDRSAEVLPPNRTADDTIDDGYLPSAVENTEEERSEEEDANTHVHDNTTAALREDPAMASFVVSQQVGTRTSTASLSVSSAGEGADTSAAIAPTDADFSELYGSQDEAEVPATQQTATFDLAVESKDAGMDKITDDVEQPAEHKVNDSENVDVFPTKGDAPVVKEENGEVDNNQWTCDFCSEEFGSFEAACAHEKACSAKDSGEVEQESPTRPHLPTALPHLPRASPQLASHATVASSTDAKGPTAAAPKSHISSHLPPSETSLAEREEKDDIATEVISPSRPHLPTTLPHLPPASPALASHAPEAPSPSRFRLPTAIHLPPPADDTPSEEQKDEGITADDTNEVQKEDTTEDGNEVDKAKPAASSNETYPSTKKAKAANATKSATGKGNKKKMSPTMLALEEAQNEETDEKLVVVAKKEEETKEAGSELSSSTRRSARKRKPSAKVGGTPMSEILVESEVEDEEASNAQEKDDDSVAKSETSSLRRSSRRAAPSPGFPTSITTNRRGGKKKAPTLPAVPEDSTAVEEPSAEEAEKVAAPKTRTRRSKRNTDASDDDASKANAQDDDTTSRASKRTRKSTPATKHDDDESKDAEQAAPPKKRGRGAKKDDAEESVDEIPETAAVSPPKRARRGKAKKAEGDDTSVAKDDEVSEIATKDDDATECVASAAPKKSRGRAKKKDDDSVSSLASTRATRRTRATKKETPVEEDESAAASSTVTGRSTRARAAKKPESEVSVTSRPRRSTRGKT